MKTSENALSLSVSGSGSLSAYINMVHSFPYLEKDEEYQLAVRYRRNNDLEAAQQLVLSHMRFVVSVARGFFGYGLPYQDLIQEGNVGLMKAVKKFDPERGVRLVSYAVHWIKAEMYDYILKNWKLVRIATTKAQKKVFFNLRQYRKRLESMTDAEVQALSSEIDVSSSIVREMETRINAPTVSWDTTPSDEDDNRYVPASYYVSDIESDPAKVYAQEQEQQHQHDMIHSALAGLSERSRDIIEQRFLAGEQKATLQQLGDQYGISAERIRQIEKKALETMRHHISHADESIH